MSEFYNQILCINCPRIILTQNSSNSPKVYQGSGSITRKSERNLELELSYFDDDHNSPIYRTFAISLGFATPSGCEFPTNNIQPQMGVNFQQIIPNSKWV